MMLRSEDEILIKTCCNLKDSLPKKLNKVFYDKNRKVEHWTTFSKKSCTQLVRSNALREAVGHGHLELQITLPQVKTQLT